MPFGTCTGAHGAYSPLDVHRGAGSQGTNPSWVLEAQCAVGAPGCLPTSRKLRSPSREAPPRRGLRKLPVPRKTASRFPPDLGKPADRFPTATAASATTADRYETVIGINPGTVQVRRPSGRLRVRGLAPQDGRRYAARSCQKPARTPAHPVPATQAPSSIRAWRESHSVKTRIKVLDRFHPLCLLDSRYAVRIDWRSSDREGASQRRRPLKT